MTINDFVEYIVRENAVMHEILSHEIHFYTSAIITINNAAFFCVGVSQIILEDHLKKMVDDLKKIKMEDDIKNKM